MDRATGAEMAARAGLVLDNARMYTYQERIAETLQDRMLPRISPRMPGCDVATRYLPGTRLGRVGDPDGAAEFRRLDASDTAAVERLHTELADANVCMRGVIHQCEAAARPAVAEAVATLIGERERAFVVEPLSAAKTVLRGIAEGEGGPPPKLAGAFSHGLTPGEVDDAAVPELPRGAGLSVLGQGPIELVMTEYRPDGSRIDLPAQWLVVGRGE